MRIAYVSETYPPEINGVALTVRRTVAYLENQGHDIELIRPLQPGEAECDRAAEWRTSGMPIPMYRDLRMGMPVLWKLERRWRWSRPDLVHVATPGPLGWAAARAARNLGITLTADFRTNFHQYSRYYGLGWLEPVACAYLRGLHNTADWSFVPTRALQRHLLQRGFHNLQVVGRGVDTRIFHPTRRCDALRAEWGADADTPVILYVGRLAAEKNVKLALLAFAGIRERQPRARMVLVGDGPQRRHLEGKACPGVIFAGVKHDAELARHYASADLFMFPSATDTFGNVVLEAMASGLPVLAYEMAAAGEHIVHGVDGLLVPPGHSFNDGLGYCEAARAASDLSAMRMRSMGEAARKAAMGLEWSSVLGDFEHRLQRAALERLHSGVQPCAV